MPDGVAVIPIEAGRQTPAHEQLSRMLWLRKSGEVFRFALDPKADPGLTLERIGPAANGGGVLTQAVTGKLDSGLVLVDGQDGLAFCTKSEPKAFLRRLAQYAVSAISSVPALALLADSGAGPLTIDPAIDAAAKDYVPDGEQVVYEPELWDALLRPDAATIAAALEAATPGERMWFWLAEDAADGAVPLILQPVAWDPNHDRTAWLIDRNAEAGAGDGATGSATIRDDGTLQFLGVGLTESMLDGLARWVDAHVEDYKALGRLVDCQLLVSSGVTIEEVIAEPALWAGVARAEVPGTIPATASVLAHLPVGGECWFWLTGGDGRAPFLHLVPVSDDADGTAFQAALPHLFKRFAQSFEDAVTGVMSQPSLGRLLFASKDAGGQAFPRQVKALLDQYGAEFSALRMLGGASLLRAEADGPPRVIATAAAA